MDKEQLRRRMKQRRRELPAPQRRAASEEIAQCVLELPEVAAAEGIFVYVSYQTEVETHELIRRLLEGETPVAVPKVLDGGQMTAVPIRRWGDLRPGACGILEPGDSAPLQTRLSVCLAPGLAFSRRGDRLGYGRGHYDRFLADHGGIDVIGLAFDSQIIEELPTEPNDIRMNAVVTQREIIVCG